MKHTDFTVLADMIKQQEQRELYQALQAHDDAYVFEEDSENGIFLPRITAYTKGFIEVVFYIDVKEAYIVNNKLFIKGETTESGDIVEVPANQTYAGELGYVIDAIEATKQLDSTMAYNFNTFEDTIDLQEISTQAVNDIMNKIDCDRFTAFELCQQWAEEFTEKYRDYDWGAEEDMSYYDHIDKFVEEKVKEL